MYGINISGMSLEDCVGCAKMKSLCVKPLPFYWRLPAEVRKYIPCQSAVSDYNETPGV